MHDILELTFRLAFSIDYRMPRHYQPIIIKSITIIVIINIVVKIVNFNQITDNFKFSGISLSCQPKEQETRRAEINTLSVNS